MGRLVDKYMGTRYPEKGVAPLPASELRDALLALNDTGIRFVIRQGTSKEGCDLVADCRVRELRLTLKIRMRLVAATREVRALDERWEPSHESSREQYGRGPATAVYKQWEFKKGPDGRRRKVETLRFDTRDVKNPLRNTVLKAGWTWRGVLFRP
ncbi:hypothetical protein [Streptomyces sp. NBC_00162]|uniref:hypothetical protein n=1 Tax=Streptomyces sp. NBC_00162 TaxID=2903629 RepID=UPI00214B7066|nr:hypothetical protein [Streptomyces sp. NBC_00162]UUU40388.1 hypothetical protein JIW86_17180 [Streptomyces sp. NBC_00162]